MAIVGLGCDIIEIERIEKSCKRSSKFVERVFTLQEQDYCNSRPNCYQHYAGRFAAKEAVGKAIGVPLNWTDVEIIHKPKGKPCVKLYGKAAEFAGDCSILISISHSKHSAVAVAILER